MGTCTSCFAFLLDTEAKHEQAVSFWITPSSFDRDRLKAIADRAGVCLRIESFTPHVPLLEHIGIHDAKDVLRKLHVAYDLAQSLCPVVVEFKEAERSATRHDCLVMAVETMPSLGDIKLMAHEAFSAPSGRPLACTNFSSSSGDRTQKVGKATMNLSISECGSSAPGRVRTSKSILETAASAVQGFVFQSSTLSMVSSSGGFRGSSSWGKVVDFELASAGTINSVPRSVSIWLEPDSPDTVSKFQDVISKVSASIEKPSFSPHVTLWGGVKVEGREHLNKVLSAIFELAGELQPFDLEFDEVETYDKWNQCLIATVKSSAQLDEASVKAQQHLFGGDQKYEPSFAPPVRRPHFSLAYENFNNEADRRRVMDDVLTAYPWMSGAGFRANSISLWDTGGGLNGVPTWKKMAEFPFRGRL